MAYTLDSDWEAANNTTGYRGAPQGFCIHHSAGMTLDMVPTFLANQTSAHYGIKGHQVRQFVSDTQGAWATGDTWANTRLLHVECVNSAGEPYGASYWPLAGYGMLRHRKYGNGRDGRRGGNRVVVGVNVDRPVRGDGHVSACPVARDWRYDKTGWPKPFRKPPDCRVSPRRINRNLYEKAAHDDNAGCFEIGYGPRFA